VELSWELLLLLCLFGAFALFWHDSLAARDLANAVARETCQSTGAVLLHGTVSFQALRVVRGDDGRPTLERTYLFEYSSDGEAVRQGFIVVRSRRVESVGLQ
jgi:hypothetical protein